MRFHDLAKRASLLLALLLCGCLVYREHGEYSIPYVDQPPANLVADVVPAELVRTVEVQGLRIQIHLRNDVRTSRRPVVGFEIPLVAGPANRNRVWVYKTDDEGHCVVLNFFPDRDGFAFDPRKLLLWVGDREYSPVRACHAAVPNSYPKVWEEVSAPVRLLPVEEMKRQWVEMGFSTSAAYDPFSEFLICYAMARPDPERVIRLDLAPALTHPDLDPLPSIRYIRGRFNDWAEY